MTCHYKPDNDKTYDYNDYYWNKPCNKKVGENDYYCIIHAFNNVCNYHHNHIRCTKYHFFYHSCLDHYYIDSKYIILSNKKVTLTHPMSSDVIDIQTYLMYDKHNCSYRYFANVSGITLKYYTVMIPRWITMYLVVKSYLHDKAYDVFSNVAMYYVHL